MSVASYIIRFLHICLVLFIIFTPFVGSPYALSMHFIIVPFIMAHWITNQSVCALTELEKFLSGKTCDDDTFIGKIVGPVYKFKTVREENLFVWTFLITLWFITYIRLRETGFSFLREELTRLRTQLHHLRR